MSCDAALNPAKPEPTMITLFFDSFIAPFINSDMMTLLVVLVIEEEEEESKRQSIDTRAKKVEIEMMRRTFLRLITSTFSQLENGN